jgi:hypothetical protein
MVYIIIYAFLKKYKTYRLCQQCSYTSKQPKAITDMLIM